MNKELSQEQYTKLNGEFKKAWPKLTDADLVLYKSTSNRAKFIDLVVERQSIEKPAAEKRLQEIETACGCSVDQKAA